MLTPEQLAVLEKVKRPANKIIIDSVQDNIDVANNPFGSWFGHIGAIGINEEWPYWNSLPMLPLCQINTKELPIIPGIISDIALICVWMGVTKTWPNIAPNGEGWQIRCYPSLIDLKPINYSFDKFLDNHLLDKVLLKLKRTKFPTPASIQWQAVDDYLYDTNESDLLTPEELKIYENIIRHEIDNDYWVSWIDESKVGGWPSIMEGQPVFKERPEIEYVFQITSYRDLGWNWGCTTDRRFGYFGYSKTDKQQWFFDQICTY